MQHSSLTGISTLVHGFDSKIKFFRLSKIVFKKLSKKKKKKKKKKNKEKHKAHSGDIFIDFSPYFILRSELMLKKKSPGSTTLSEKTEANTFS